MKHLPFFLFLFSLGGNSETADRKGVESYQLPSQASLVYYICYYTIRTLIRLVTMSGGQFLFPGPSGSASVGPSVSSG